MPGDKRIYAITIAAAAFLVFIGALMPWAKATAPFVGEVTRSGTEDGGDGVFTLLMALASFGLVAWYQFGRGREKPQCLALAIIGALIIAIAIYDIADIENVAGEVEQESESLVEFGVGEGLYLTLIGGIGLAGASAAGFFRRRPETLSAPVEPTSQEDVAGPNESG